jgi:hypothetical protein
MTFLFEAQNVKAMRIILKLHIMKVYNFNYVDLPYKIIKFLSLWVRIDQDSPLYSFGPEDLKTKRIEILIWLSGTRSKTGTAISGTASYTSDEIIWGGR